MKKLTFLALSTALALAGCASSSVEEKIEIKRVNAIAMKEQKAQVINNAIDAIPEWFLDVPQPDTTGVYGVGFGESNKPHFSLKVAELQAKFDLAKQFKEIISGQERSYESQASNGDVTSQANAIIDSLVDEVQIAGFQRVERKVLEVDGKAASYVLLKMPYDQYNTMLLQARKASDTEDMTAAFVLMTKRINDRRMNRIKADEALHRREMDNRKADIEEMKVQNLQKDSSTQSAVSPTGLLKTVVVNSN